MISLNISIDYHLTSQGIPQNKTHYTQYALFATPSGVTLEIVEINVDNPGIFHSPIPSFTVKSLPKAVDALEQRDDVERLQGIIGSAQWGWVYVRIAGGLICQIQGPRSI